MIHLDTHVLVWVAAGEHRRLPEWLRVRLPRMPLRISPMAELELHYLEQVGRLGAPAAEVLERLRSRLDLRVAEASFARVSSRACGLTWTRDPFDRLIAASALCDDLPLATADRRMLTHCPVATWDQPPFE